jgi:16S rRNA processing protein RimM
LPIDGQVYVALGHVTGAHGLQGWIKVYSDTRPRENIANFAHLLLQQTEGWQTWKVNSGRRQGKYVVIKLEGCDDRNQAEALVGAKIAVYRNQLPQLEEPGHFYWTDLQGLQVINTAGVELGVVDYLLETGANDVLVVKGDRERLIPYLWEQVVQDVDLSAKRILVDWDANF